MINRSTFIIDALTSGVFLAMLNIRYYWCSKIDLFHLSCSRYPNSGGPPATSNIRVQDTSYYSSGNSNPRYPGPQRGRGGGGSGGGGGGGGGGPPQVNYSTSLDHISQLLLLCSMIQSDEQINNIQQKDEISNILRTRLIILLNEEMDSKSSLKTTNIIGIVGS